MCSSRRSLSISRFPYMSRPDLRGARQHSLELAKVCGCVFRQGLFDLFRKCLRVVDGSPDFGFRPSEVFGDGVGVVLVTTNEQQHFPHGERASLDVGLSAGSRIAEI